MPIGKPFKRRELSVATRTNPAMDRIRSEAAKKAWESRARAKDPELDQPDLPSADETAKKGFWDRAKDKLKEINEPYARASREAGAKVVTALFAGKDGEKHDVETPDDSTRNHVLIGIDNNLKRLGYAREASQTHATASVASLVYRKGDDFVDVSYTRNAPDTKQRVLISKMTKKGK